MRQRFAGRRAWLRACAATLLAPALRTARAQDEDAALEEPGEDHRAWQHGVELLRVGPRLLLIWGSAGNPPRPILGGDWPHDIYYDWLEPGGEGEIAIRPKVLVSRDEAQEPPSAAINSRGDILVTAEDGEDDINQRAGLWDAQLRPRKPYPFMIRKGGHSGHVAALGERFLIAYGEGWQDGGGFMNRGTGRDVHARIVDASGRPGHEITLARGHRDGWPVLAASDRNWLVVWQRYQGLMLYCAAIDAQGRAGPPRLLADGLSIRYAYDVAYVPAFGYYLVCGNRGGKGFAAVVDRGGAVLRVMDDLPPLASEARVLVGPEVSGRYAVYATAPRGIAVLGLDAAGAHLVRVVEHPHRWDYMGTTGVYLDSERILFATLTTRGIRVFTAGW